MTMRILIVTHYFPPETGAPSRADSRGAEADLGDENEHAQDARAIRGIPDGEDRAQ